VEHGVDVIYKVCRLLNRIKIFIFLL
jgi:hypothetical protein